MPYANTEAMSAHLTEISRHVSPGAHAILVIDGAGWHSSKDLVIPDNRPPWSASTASKPISSGRR